MIRTTEVAAQPSAIEATSRIPCHADPALREKHLCSSFPLPFAWRLNPRFFPARLQSARDGPHGAGGAPYGGSSWTTTAYDAMSRVKTTTDPDGGTLSFTYSANDVLRTLKPAPSGENAKSAQYQYDGLGRLTSACEITGASGSGACSQNTAATGFFTSYTYNALNELTGVSQSGQTRSYGFDALGRLTSEANPETGTTHYYYDSDSTCGNSPGDMVKKVDALSNVACYHYDAIHRLTSLTYPSGSYSGSTPEKVFVYDSATVNGNAMQNTPGRLAEAYTCTGSCSAKITDLGFSYDADGNMTQVWESTPHSNGYYEVRAATYWPNGLPETLQLLNNLGGALIPQISYNPDGEGRISTVGATGTGQQNPVTSTSYNLYASPPSLQVTFGSGDSDLFKYDANTGRLTQYNFNVNSEAVTGNVGWNANGTLSSLSITDPFNPADAQTCKFGDPNALPPVPGYDDLGRLINVNCGSAWKQSFSADAFGNLTKTGLGGAAESFQPTYNLFNQVSALGSHAPTYDADGNTTNDTVNSYNWDSDGNMIKAVTPSATTQVTYDAMDRALELSVGSSYTEIVYGPGGGKLALMSGQTLTKAFVPLSGVATAVYNSSGSTAPAYYRHADWLGSSRFASLPSGTNRLYYDGAYAPYGENYAETGTTDRSFTGQNQDMVSTGSYPLYDFLMREYNATWGRWISPDPAGLAAVDMTNPQTWNRYAYVANNPLALIDPTGLQSSPGEGPPACGYGNEPTCEEMFGYGGWQPALWSPDGVFCGARFSACYGNAATGAFIAFTGPNSGWMFQWLAIDSILSETGQPIGGFVGTWMPFFTVNGYRNGSSSNGGAGGSWWGGFSNAYGQALGTLGEVFRGRPPGQSFAACVGQNMSRTFTGSPRSPVSTTVSSGIVAISGVALGGPTFGGATIAARLALVAKVFLSALPQDEAAEAALISGAAAAGGAATPIALGVGAIGLAPLVGSAANCASVGVAP